MAIVSNDNYKGFSSKQFERNKSYKLTNVQLVNEDLKNHIFTRRGERIRMPTFGTQIPELVYEPLDEYTVAIINDELRMVFEYDPRVRLLDMRVVPVPSEGYIYVVADLEYVYLNVIDRLDLRIDLEEIG